MSILGNLKGAFGKISNLLRDGNCLELGDTTRFSNSCGDELTCPLLTRVI
tara:strand:+ start:340 stop:489 length:150 start_codon:yes stop_codon:yes gene_type:complete